MFNETKWYAETATYRAVTNQSSNIHRANGRVAVATLPNVGTIPVALTKTGTFSSNGLAVVGSGTLFNSECKKGDYIYNGAVVRQIMDVIDDTHLNLYEAFPSNQSAVNFLICERQFYKAIYAQSTSDSDSAILQEAPFRPGSTFLNGGAPIAYDATTGEISFTVHK